MDKDVEALDRVLFRLASVDDDERLLQVLQSLLPQLVTLFPRSLSTPLEIQLKDKILQVVTHVKTRLQALTRPALPLAALSQVLQTPELSVFSYNMASLFIEMGFAAASKEEQTLVLSRMAMSLSTSSSGQQETFFRLLVRALPVHSSALFPREQTTEVDAEGDAPMNPPVENDNNITVVLDFLLDLVLYDLPPSAARDSAAYGLLAPRIERLKRVNILDLKRDELYDRQLHALKFVKELEIPTKQKIMVYLAGSGSFHHAVKAFGEEQLSRVVKYESAQLEDADVTRRIMALILGSQVVQSAGAFEGRDALLLSNRTRMADASILQALTLLSKSEAATNVLPLMLQLLCQLLFGEEPSRPPNVSNKIKLATMRLCEWTFHHCQPTFLEGLLGPVMFPTLLRLLMNPHTESEALSAEFVREFRQGVYETLALLATRVPGLVAASEQAFQVLLVRSLAEEEQRTGAGANAVKAFASLARAYTTSAPVEVRTKVHDELIALLNGSRLFDPTKNYARVRAAIAAWCAELLTSKASNSEDITMRFALLRLSGVADEDTKRLSSKALLTKPLPSTSALATSLQKTFPDHDLKKSMRDVGAAENCVRFCVEVLKASHEQSSESHSSDRKLVVEYVFQTLVGRSEQTIPVAVFDTAAHALVELCALDAEVVGAVLCGHIQELIAATNVSQDRLFLANIATVVSCSCGALSADQIMSEIVQIGKSKLDNSSVANEELCGVLYVVGSALRHLDSVVNVSHVISDEDMKLLLYCYRKMVDLLESKTREGSDFTKYPRNEHDQTTQVALLRSVMDGVGNAGSLGIFMQNVSTDTGNEWSQLKRKSLDSLRSVIDWKLKAVHFDDQLNQKLSGLKQIAVENLGRSTSGLPTIASDLSSALEEALKSVLDLGDEVNAELQFTVGEALVALGAHDHKQKFPSDRETKYDSFGENRAAIIFERVLTNYAGSRQPKVRRNAAVWLLCMCAAGLSATDEIPLASPKSWINVFATPAYSQSVLEVHEFFVTMLNDADEIAKESAVKGLAYLRLRAPTEEMGAQFSDSLFRRLRCFRAFATSADAVDESPDTARNDTSNNGVSAANAVAASSSASTVENAAYREVSNVAADVGDPELMYALLYLSTADPIWESFASVPAGKEQLFRFSSTDKHFRAGIVAKAGNLWMADEYAHKSKLVPWLFLLKFHSNDKVAAVMTNLWEFAKGNTVLAGTQKGEKALLQQNWTLLFNFALTRLENARNFKYREAACLALVDLLNGAEASDVREDFARLWKTASRAVDDVMEAVALAGVKLYRYLGELSLRIATSDATCRSQLLEFLIEQGIVNKNTICRALSIDVLLRLVKTLKAEDMQDRLAPLILKLLEYLSSLEMPELQYAQFHVEKKDQLERLRVSLSQAGPVGQLLELTTTRLKELAGTDGCVAVVNQLVRGVANLLKFGVGLNTRVGTANFVVTLAGELPFELRKCNGAEFLLHRVFTPYIGAKTADENDQYDDEESRYGNADTNSSEVLGNVMVTSGLSDGLVVQAYCRAAAYLCPLVDAPVVRDYVRSGIFAFNSLSAQTLTNGESAEQEDAEDGKPRAQQVYTSRFLLISALATMELVKKVPPIADVGSVVADDMRNTWYCTNVFPAAYIGQYAATSALKNSWTVVLDELPPTVLYSASSLDSILHSIAQLLAHPAWDTRRQAARALQAVFASATYRARLSPSQVARIWQDLLDAVPGRLWRGKGVILESLVALAAVKVETSTVDDDWMEMLSSVLVDECTRAWKNHDLSYLESAIVNLGKFSALLPSQQSSLRAANVRALRSGFNEWMTVIEVKAHDNVDRLSLPPLLIKCVFEALALMWPEIQKPAPSTTDDSNAKTTVETILWLCTSVESPHLGVWSVRKAVFQALAALLGRAPETALAEGNSSIVERVVDCCCGSFGVGDGKYSMIRVAAASALTALLKRGAENAGVLLRLVVQREQMMDAVQTLLASEEASEQQAAFAVKNQLLQMA